VDCNYVLSRARAAASLTTAPQARINALTDAFNECYENFEIDDCLRRAHFFAQVLTEVGANGEPRRENAGVMLTAKRP
jgi:putative chitinase